MNNRIRRLSAAACLSVILLMAVSCGRKTEPATPDSPRPEAVRIISAAARDNVAILSWQVPARNVERKAIPANLITACEVFRAEVARDRRKSRFKQVAVIDPAKPVDAEVTGGVILWKDRDLKYGQVYAYQVRCETAQGWPGPQSEEVRVAPLLTVAFPQNLAATSGDGRIDLAWDAVATKADGSKHAGFIGYNVYRSTAAGRFEGAPINTEPVRTNAYRDTAIVNGTTYYYMVRAVDSPVLPWRESLDSKEASATPQDTTPPVRPTGLTVVPGVGRIFLTWNENAEADLVGYQVYRSEKSGKDYRRMTEAAIKRTTYSDETPKPGATYYYAVSAVDAAGNESALSKELSAAAEAVPVKQKRKSKIQNEK